MKLGPLLLVIACASASAQALTVERAQEMVREDLMDPFSARFRHVKLADSGVVCGQVNAKNSYGAYTGWQPFIVTAAKGVLLRPTGTDVGSQSIRGHFDRLVREVCPPA